MMIKLKLSSMLFIHPQRFLIPGMCFFLLFAMPLLSNGQAEQDTVEIEQKEETKKKGSIFSGRPGKSLLMSLVIPGAGQIYNKSYLRVPFVWAAVGGMGYVLINNTHQYNCFKEAYIDKIDGNPLTIPAYCYDEIPFTTIETVRLDDATDSTVRRLRDQANVNRQWAIVGFALVWLANGVDAFVDAHLKDFDIDEDLSIDIGPKIENEPFAPMRVGVFVQF